MPHPLAVRAARALERYFAEGALDDAVPLDFTGCTPFHRRVLVTLARDVAPGETVSYGELAARAGVSIRTVDHYTTLGLIAPAQRTASNYRLYRCDDVGRIHLVQRLEVHGLPLEDIAKAFRAKPADTAFGCSRDFLDGRFVYTVISPRARGLSVGVNMNPDKRCNFDCVY